MIKKLTFTIGLCLLTLTTLWSPENVSAKILDECQLKAYPTLNSNSTLSDLDFRVAFETASNQYHEYVNCVFNKATESVLNSAGGDPKNLLNPDSACLTDSNPKKLKDLLADSSPENLIQPLLKSYQDYAAYLKQLQNILDNQPDLNPQNIGINDIIERRTRFQLLIANETQNSIVALDNAFLSLKELRASYVMHQHFQCMLKNLENYRRALVNLRSVIEVMPPLFHNASTH